MNTAADQVMDLIFGRWRSQTLSAGTELGVFDHLDKRQAKTAETLAGEVDADPALPIAYLGLRRPSAYLKRTARADLYSPTRATSCGRTTLSL